MLWLFAFVVLSLGGAEYGYQMGKDMPEHKNVVQAIVNH